MGALRKGRRLRALVVMASLGAAPGCMSCFNPVAAPQADWVTACCALPRLERNHVYIFMMNGLDPVNCCNLTGVRDCVHKLGFIKTYYGQPVHYYWFASEIRRLSDEDPDARFVLVGSQFGANVLDQLARDLESDGVTIDLAYFLDGGMLSCDEGKRPANILQTVNVWSGKAILKGRHLPGAENLCVHDASVFGCGPHPETIERLALELALVAASVPVETTDVPAPEQAPMPRPAAPELPRLSAEWSFLEARTNRAGTPGTANAKSPLSRPVNLTEQLSATIHRDKGNVP